MAGFFGFFDYTKVGPGVDKDAPPKRPFFLMFDLLFRKFSKLIQLNILYLFCCLPIITIGPATAGFVYVLRNFVREEHAWITSDFFDHGFKRNGKQAFIHGLLSMVIFFLIAFSIRYYYVMLNTQTGNVILYTVALVLSIVCFLLFSFMQYYIYLLMVTFYFSLSQLYKNALIFAASRFFSNLFLTIAVLAILIAGIYNLLIGFVLMVTILPALCGFIIVFWCYRPIKKLILDKAEPQDEANDANETDAD